MTNRLRIFDTTLRDGLQSPGIHPVTLEGRVAIGLKLAEMGVDIIEAGFAIGGKLDYDTIATLAQKGLDATVCSLARTKRDDIEAAGNALKAARSGRIHTFISTSPLHMEHKLRLAPDAVLQAAIDGVKLARSLSDDVQFSLEDYTRTEREFSYKVIEAVINAGATTINLPDTVGYSTPDDYAELIAGVVNNVPNIDKAVISTHCHNDLGLAVANSLAGAQAGARQIECSINGIGERAGNAAMEEIVMAMRVRRDRMKLETGVRTEYFMAASELVQDLTGMAVQRNKAIVGANAFAHESGIHQHGVGKNRETYEIMTPESVGQKKSAITLGVTSGRDGLRRKMEELGYTLQKEQIDKLYPLFMDEAAKGRVTDAKLKELAAKL
ncbi:MAG: 2-isopropylmalate synthase [Proteobacteria bacterium]|nr:2-isopropylmalate synthase [Pseudomonadota bacterium]